MRHRSGSWRIFRLILPGHGASGDTRVGCLFVDLQLAISNANAYPVNSPASICCVECKAEAAVGKPAFLRTFARSRGRFATQAGCRRYLLASRWPDGFRCPLGSLRPVSSPPTARASRPPFPGTPRRARKGALPRCRRNRSPSQSSRPSKASRPSIRLTKGTAPAGPGGEHTLARRLIERLR
jgi:hypothetical protein